MTHNVSFGNTSGIAPTQEVKSTLLEVLTELKSTQAYQAANLPDDHVTIEALDETGVTLTDRRLVHIPAKQMNGTHAKLLKLVPAKDTRVEELEATIAAQDKRAESLKATVAALYSEVKRLKQPSKITQLINIITPIAAVAYFSLNYYAEHYYQCHGVACYPS